MTQNLNPEVPKGEFAIIQVEVRTGIVLDLSGKRYTGTGERFLLFKTLEEAMEKSRNIVKDNPEIECIIHDDSNVQVTTVRDDIYVQQILEKAREARKKEPGWKFWK